MLCAPQPSGTLSYWLILPVSPPLSNTVRYGGSEADMRATAVESAAELLAERLPAARCLACSLRLLRRLHSAGHQEGPLSECSWAPWQPPHPRGLPPRCRPGSGHGSSPHLHPRARSCCAGMSRGEAPLRSSRPAPLLRRPCAPQRWSKPDCGPPHVRPRALRRASRPLLPGLRPFEGRPLRVPTPP